MCLKTALLLSLHACSTIFSINVLSDFQYNCIQNVVTNTNSLLMTLLPSLKDSLFTESVQSNIRDIDQTMTWNILLVKESLEIRHGNPSLNVGLSDSRELKLFLVLVSC